MRVQLSELSSQQRSQLVATPAVDLRLLGPLLKLMWLLMLLLITSVCALAQAQDFVPVPPLQSRVTDQVGMLSAEQRGKLENVLAEYEQRTGSQIAILLLATTAPEAIEQYSIRVADAWKLGRKGVDDGVILVVAKDNPPALRRLRIEAGRGVQGSLTDAQSKRILQDVIAPHFRQNDFYGGLAAGVSAIAAAIDKEQLPARQQAAADQDELGGWLPLLVLLAFIAMAIRSRLRHGARAFSSDGWGRSAGVILGAGLGHRGYGDFRSGRGGMGGWSGSGGGGGFSGGGGGFDGGGASGNW